jgi:hypothetical protein
MLNTTIVCASLKRSKLEKAETRTLDNALGNALDNTPPNCEDSDDLRCRRTASGAPTYFASSPLDEEVATM